MTGVMARSSGRKRDEREKRALHGLDGGARDAGGVGDDPVVDTVEQLGLHAVGDGGGVQRGGEEDVAADLQHLDVVDPQELLREPPAARQPPSRSR